ncbi:hypothetical protein BKM63_09710 [Flavobacterium johnsoniae]|uniref:Uncharacterized protein n=1 Tax=Flavobacterium johnsoniae TaxID=986 RepID=A0A1J7BT87_FLAJO|nr:hypothetical protein BKM63_09710 [Flavobacterium johnsoniae]
MESKNNIQKQAVSAGIFVSTFYSVIIFSQHSFVSLLTQICDFGRIWNPIFWKILFPVFIIFLFGKASKKLNLLLNQTTYFKTCLKFSMEISSKIIVFLFTIYIGGLLVNGINSALHGQIQSQIVFSLIIILVLTFLLMIFTFISSLIIIKLNQNTQNLNQIK